MSGLNWERLNASKNINKSNVIIIMSQDIRDIQAFFYDVIRLILR